MLTIGEFSKICRVSTKTLRYYDQIGLLKPTQVGSDSGYRYYTVSQLKDMLLITRLKQYYFSLPEIAAVLAKNDNAFLAESIRMKRTEIQQQIENQEYVLRQMERDIEKIERNESIMNTGYVIKTTEFKPTTIFSIRKKMGLKDFSEVFGELCVKMERSRIKPSGYYLSIYHDDDFNPEETDIEVGVDIAGGSGENIRVLDPGLCCYASHIGPYDDFTPCYTAISEWVAKEGYSISGAPFEVYVKGHEGNLPPSEYVTEIYWPIKK